MKLPNIPNFTNLRDQTEVTRYTSVIFDQIQDIVNGGINFSENMSVSIISCAFGVANQQYQFSHSLKRKPIGYIVIGVGSAITIYDGVLPNDTGAIYLRASGPGNAKVMVI